MEPSLRLTVPRAEAYTKVNYALRIVPFYFIMFLGHMILYGGYRGAAFIVAVVNWILGIITGHNQRELTQYLQSYMRFKAQFLSSLLGLVEDIPHIDIAVNNPNFSVKCEVSSTEAVTPLACFLRLSFLILVLVIDHLLVISLAAVVGVILYIVGLFMVAIKGTWNPFIHGYLTNLLRWILTVEAYILGLSDTRPDFMANLKSLKP